MDNLKIGELFAKLKPRILELINITGGGSGPFAPTPHDLNSPHHTGSLADAQAPQFLKTDGSRTLVGNLSVANGITIDGVDVSVFKSAYDTHAGLDAATAHGSVGIHSHQSNPQGGKLDHGLALEGLLDDDHTQYAHADGSGTRPAYEAARLNKSIIAGSGLTGGGLLTQDRTLSILLNSAWSGLSVDGNGLRVDTAASFTWTNDHTFRGITKTRHLQPELTDTYDLGSSTLLWRKGWLSELDTILFAQNTVALLGGWLLITKDEGAIDADVAPENTQVNFGKTMTVGDFVLFRAAGKVEYMQVGSLVSGTTYNVTRNLDGSGADTWAAGTPFAVLGQAGQGRIELNAFDTPRLQMIRQGATYNAQTEIIRIGDLNGNWGYTSQKWGMAIGEYASGKPNITIDQDGVMRFRIHATDVMRFESGNANLTGQLRMPGTSSAITIGSTPPTSATSGTGIWIDRTGLYSLSNGTYQVKIDAVDGRLYAGGGNVSIDSTGIKIIYGSLEFNRIRWMSSNFATEFGSIYMFNDGYSSLFRVDLDGSTKFEMDATSLRSAIGTGLAVGYNVSTTGMFSNELRVGGNVTLYGGFITGSTAISCRVIRSTDQSISSGAWTAISFSSATWDDRPSGVSAQWSSGSPTRLTCRANGLYLITGHLSFAGNSTGRRIGRVYLNGSTEIALQSHPAISTNPVHLTFSVLRKLTAGDYIELGAFQDSGGALNVLTGTYTPVLSWTRIA